MPYISQADRRLLGGEYADNFPLMEGAGQLNYMLTLLIHWYFKTNGKNYQAINDIIGALDGCKMEFYRHVVAPYEDGKIKENGDVAP